ncbi:4'-phosphopantetheinyl transferase family protein [Arthrobacter sp. N1]|uniref:4'-phosphopantetheinyl transferase family protein n=1 Tax=Arthrobacter sp. N1 TaxID=619291 RepID=UPI003BAE2BCC
MTSPSLPGTASPAQPSGVVVRLLRTGPTPGLHPAPHASGEPGRRAPARLDGFDEVHGLDALERERAGRFVDPVRAAQFVAGRAALRELAAELLDVGPGRLRSDFSCPRCSPAGGSDHGRPGYTVDGVRTPLSLSLSRAAGFVLVGGLTATGDRADEPQSLGVDLTAVTEVDFDGFDDVALTVRERRAVHGTPPDGRAATRARLWARKEAVAKALGTGFGGGTDPGAGAGPPTGARAGAEAHSGPGRGTRPLEPHELDVLDDARVRDLHRIDGVLLTGHGLAAAVAVGP